MWRKTSNQWKDWTTLRLLRLPETTDIQDSTSAISEAGPCDAPIRCQNSFTALTNRGRSVSGTATGVCKTRISWREVIMSTECRLIHQKQERSLLVRKVRGSGSHLHRGLG